jgi:hypothetical protein
MNVSEWDIYTVQIRNQKTRRSRKNFRAEEAIPHDGYAVRARTSSFFFFQFFVRRRGVFFLISVNPYDAYGHNKGVQDIQERFFFFFCNSSYAISGAFLFFWCGSILVTQRVQRTRIRILFESLNQPPDITLTASRHLPEK